MRRISLDPKGPLNIQVKSTSLYSCSLGRSLKDLAIIV